MKKKAISFLLSTMLMFSLFAVNMGIAASAAGFASGTGTQSDPYIITTADELSEMRNFLSPNTYFELGNNIDLTSYLAGTVDGWAPIAQIGQPGQQYSVFSGNLDGKGFKIAGFWSNRSAQSYVGLFGYMMNASVKDLTIYVDSENGGIKGDNYVGTLAGYTEETSIQNCNAYTNATGNTFVGGLVGMARRSMTFENCYVSGTILGSNYVGGIIGANEGVNVSNCESFVNVNGYINVGGMFGMVSGSITDNCSSSGIVTSTEGYAGGLTGRWYSGNLTNSTSSCTVTGNGYSGGLIGYFQDGTLSGSSAKGDVEATSYAGGLVGASFQVIDNCFATGSVSADSYVGGLVGFQGYAMVSNSYSSGPVTGNVNVGGFVGAMANNVYFANNYFYSSSLQIVGVGNNPTVSGVTLI